MTFCFSISESIHKEFLKEYQYYSLRLDLYFHFGLSLPWIKSKAWGSVCSSSSISERFELVFSFTPSDCFSHMAISESLDHCSGEMIPSKSSVPKPVGRHGMSPEPLIEKNYIHWGKMGFANSKLCKTAFSWVMVQVIETILFLSVFLRAAETYLITVIKSL